MGYCQQDDCARVLYQEYLPAVVCWRYPGEAWQEIEADDYTCKKKLSGQNTYQYYVDIRRRVVSGHSGGYYIDDVQTLLAYGPIGSIGFDTRRQSGYVTDPDSFIKTPTYDAISCYFYARDPYIQYVAQVYVSAGAQPPEFNQIEIINITPRYGQQEQNNYIFTITKNGQTIYSETRAVCPEVEKLAGRLSQAQKQIEVKKQPDIETIDVNQISIPSNCWNIYLKSGDSSQFVKQICSKGSLPPVYQVVCGCDRPESCPPNTCPVKCGNKVCCYGANGVSVKSINLSSYG